MSNYKLKSYLLNTSLNNHSIAIYESDIDYELRVEVDNKKASTLPLYQNGYAKQTFAKRFIKDTLTDSIAEMFIENETDILYNQARAVKDVLNGLRVNGDIEQAE